MDQSATPVPNLSGADDLASLLQHYGALFPPVPEALEKLLDPPAHASEDFLRRTFAERRELFATRTGEHLPKPVRQQNLALLQRLDSLAPELEAHIAALRAWRLLAEAAAFIDQRLRGRARHRLDEAATLLAGHTGTAPLAIWLRDLEADLRQPPPAPPPPEPPPPVAAPPLLLVPPEASAVAGQPFVCSYVLWPAATSLVAEGLPPGLALDTTRTRIHGTPTTAGDARIEFTATSPAGDVHACLTLHIAPAATPRPEPTAPPPVASPPVASATIVASEPVATPPTAADRFTLHLANGRRLHVFAAPRVRLGRATESDLRITVCARGNPAATKSLTGEISRQHAEVFLEGNEARVCDGWRGAGQPSSFGTFLDSQNVPDKGATLQTGQVLHLTSHALGSTVPHWKVRLLQAAELADAPAPLKESCGSGGLHGVWLQRLDELPDDVLLLAGACNLEPLGLNHTSAWLWRTGGGFLVIGAEGEPHPLEWLTSVAAGSTLAPAGTVHPHDLREALARAALTEPG